MVKNRRQKHYTSPRNFHCTNAIKYLGSIVASCFRDSIHITARLSKVYGTIGSERVLCQPHSPAQHQVNALPHHPSQHRSTGIRIVRPNRYGHESSQSIPTPLNQKNPRNIHDESER
jgi:hypothetical protein